MNLLTPENSVIFFVMTIGVGYSVLIWAFSDAKRLHDWYRLDIFDKTLQTFVVGGIVTLSSLVLLSAPFDSLINEGIPAFWGWFSVNLIPFSILESAIFIFLKIVIEDLLTHSPEETKKQKK